MDLVTGAMGSLLPKLAELLKEEYMLKKAVKEAVISLEKEMKSMHAALRKVAEVPRDQLDEQVKLWAGEVRELSFDMEDVVDKFLVRVDDDGSKTAAKSNRLKQLTEKMAGLFTKGKARHQIADAIKEINRQVKEVAERRGRYTIDNIVARPPAAVTPIDPRLGALYKDLTELVGFAGKRDQELMKLLSEGDNLMKNKLRIVSVVGFGGLGKTTLVKTVYDKIKGGFECNAFVLAGQNADAKKVFIDILLDLGMYESHLSMLDERQLINKLRETLENKRYLIVIDDIWDEALWKVINWAFSSSNNFGSRLITTTRIVSVSKFCCSSTNDSVYQLEPLSDEDSRRLFYKRIFSHESGCPREFEEVSIDILKKCGGVPLAIITVASLLASNQQVKPKDEWHVLLNSIGCGLTEDPSVEEMLKILSFSYYDLPSHLKTCLLYLRMFPEDYLIGKDRVIWMWIAESFVQCEKSEASLFEVGETYFNELVNRNMIQPVYGHKGTVYACRVHDMVLDLISSLSSEGNFATILNGTGDRMPSQSNIRRMSLQNVRKEEGCEATPLEAVSMLQVRSIALFRPAIGLMPSFSSFVVLHVLELTGCYLADHDHLNLRDLGSLLHLRYLGLARTSISKLPEEVGKLQFLQVLDLSGNDHIEELPLAVINLRRLMCLLIDSFCERLPDGLGNLTSMEVLSEIHGEFLSTVKELGNMKRLRKLQIIFDNLSLELEEAFVESLGKLSNIQSLYIFFDGADMESVDLLGERWMPPRSLQEFVTTGGIKFSTMPAWIRRNLSHLSKLSKLDICVDQVGQEYVEILGRLPALRILSLNSLCQSGPLLVGAGGFRCLTSFKWFFRSPCEIVFQAGAMPKAEQVELEIGLWASNEEAAGNLGLGELLSLRDVCVYLHRKSVTIRQAKRAEAALEKALRAHPNSPTFEISICPDVLRKIKHVEAKSSCGMGPVSNSDQGHDSAIESVSSRETWPLEPEHSKSAAAAAAAPASSGGGVIEVDRAKDIGDRTPKLQVILGSSCIDRATLREVARERIDLVAEKMKVMPEEHLEEIKNELRSILEGIGHPDHVVEFLYLQRCVQCRGDLTPTALSVAHHVQLEILVAIKTSIQAFLHPRVSIPQSRLAEVFLYKRCPNIACQSALPADECRCNVCARRNGFCNLCMCVICNKFDFDVNTCRWVGCNFCSHWTHADCAIRDGQIGKGQPIKSGTGHAEAEMLFRCQACHKTSRLFGWVKDVFQQCVLGWDRDSLLRELELVCKIFRLSEDPEGKNLFRKCANLIERLRNSSPDYVNPRMIMHALRDTALGVGDQGEGREEEQGPGATRPKPSGGPWRSRIRWR